jgi:hypothetical protein
MQHREGHRPHGGPWLVLALAMSGCGGSEGIAAPRATTAGLPDAGHRDTAATVSQPASQSANDSDGRDRDAAAVASQPTSQSANGSDGRDRDAAAVASQPASQSASDSDGGTVGRDAATPAATVGATPTADKLRRCYCLTYPSLTGGTLVVIEDCFSTRSECASRRALLRRRPDRPVFECETASRIECAQSVHGSN